MDAQALAQFDSLRSMRVRAGEDQLAWFEKTLKDSDADWYVSILFIYMQYVLVCILVHNTRSCHQIVLFVCAVILVTMWH